METQNASVLSDARNIIISGTRRPLRSGEAATPNANDTISVYQKLTQRPRSRRRIGHRMVAHSARRGIVEWPSLLFGIPLFQIRGEGMCFEIKGGGNPNGAEQTVVGRFGEAVSHAQSIAPSEKPDMDSYVSSVSCITATMSRASHGDQGRKNVDI